MPRHRTPTSPAPSPPPATGTAHLYGRISEPEQRKGGGLVRQVAESADQAQEFCHLFGFTLSPRVRVDDGISAFKGLNLDPKHELGKFMADVVSGDVRP